MSDRIEIPEVAPDPYARRNPCPSHLDVESVAGPRYRSRANPDIVCRSIATCQGYTLLENVANCRFWRAWLKDLGLWKADREKLERLSETLPEEMRT